MRLDQEARRKLVGRLSGGLVLTSRRTPSGANKDGLSVTESNPESHMVGRADEWSNPAADAEQLIRLFCSLRAA
jgi:hypothetical protein